MTRSGRNTIHPKRLELPLHSSPGAQVPISCHTTTTRQLHWAKKRCNTTQRVSSISIQEWNTKPYPTTNPYTFRQCRDCDIAKGKIKLAKVVPENELCAACKCLHLCYEASQYTIDNTYGERLKISVQADQTEVEENTRAAHSLLSSFSKMNMQIRKHVYEAGVKNPEYLINDNIADRKGIESPNGGASGFNKAIKQGCSIVVLDLDMHPDKFKNLPSIKLASAINNRHLDFGNGIISECYVIYNDKAGKITTDSFSGDTRQTKERIRAELEKIKGDRSHL